MPNTEVPHSIFGKDAPRLQWEGINVQGRCGIINRPHDSTWPYQVTDTWCVEAMVSCKDSPQADIVWANLNAAFKVIQPHTYSRFSPGDTVATIHMPDPQSRNVITEISSGFLHDFASIPSVVTFALGLRRDDPLIAEASIVHDAWCKMSRWWAWGLRERLVAENRLPIWAIQVRCWDLYRSARYFGDCLAASIAERRGLRGFRLWAFYRGMRYGSRFSNFEASTH